MSASDHFPKSVPDEGSYEASNTPWPNELRVFKGEGRLEIDFSDGKVSRVGDQYGVGRVGPVVR